MKLIGGFKMAENTETGLLQNKLFLQYLAGLGADLSAAGADTSKGFQPTNVNAITQQNIQSQNMMKLLKSLLGPDGTKATFSNTGINLTIPKESQMFSNILQGTGEGGVWEGMAPPLGAPKIQPNQASMQGGGSTVVNPFVENQSSFDISPSDLAGLTTQDISTVLGMKMKRDENIADSAYKAKLMENIDSEIEARRPKFEIPGIGAVNASQYMDWLKLNNEKKPNEAKLYEYAIAQGFKGSFEDFENRTKTTHMKDYEAAVQGGYKGDFNTWLTQLAKAGAINLGAEIEKKKALGGVQSQLDVMSPDYARNIISKTVGVKGWEYDNMSAIDDIVKKHPNLSQDQATQALKMATVRSTMDREIKQAFSDKEVQYAKDGWYVDGKLVVRDPYAK